MTKASQRSTPPRSHANEDRDKARECAQDDVDHINDRKLGYDNIELTHEEFLALAAKAGVTPE